MSVSISRPSNILSDCNRRNRLRANLQRQQSFSLDIPQNIYNKLPRGLDSSCFEEPLRCRDEDRVFLYLPRNLSYCEVCTDVIRDHVQRKVRLLSSRLCQLDDVPPTPVEIRPIFGVGEESEDEDLQNDVEKTCTVNSRSCYPINLNVSSSRTPKQVSILKRKVRAVSFPAPHREGKKIVRFADALGLELESIRYLVQKDLPKTVQSCSELGLKTKIPNDKIPDTGKKTGKIQLMPCFLPPSLSTAFQARLKKLNVCLHSVSTADSTVYGIISVVNVTFHKTIFVRYSANCWASYHDELATYLDGSSVDDTDKFTFTLFCNPSDLSTRGHSLFFAVCFQTADKVEYWDNNDGKNYCIKLEKREIPTVGNHSWVHFL